MKNTYLTFFTTALLALTTNFNAKAQDGIINSIVVNGGVFEFTPPFIDYVTVTSVNFYTRQLKIVDTIYTQSAQDIFVDTNFFYVAAADSIVKYDNAILERVGAVAFGAPSTVKLIVHDNYLIVGNWYGSSDNNLRIFNKKTLEFVDSIPELIYGAKDFVVYKDSLFVQQNLSNSSFGDSAGFISVVDLSNMSFVRDIQLNNSGHETGRMILNNEIIYTLNSNSNSITTYDISNGNSTNTILTADIEVGPYGQQFAHHSNDLFLKVDGKLKLLDLGTFTLDTTTIIDSVTAVIFDELQDIFIVTKTDFASYSICSRHLRDGTLWENFEVDESPEVIGGIYGTWGGVNNKLLTSDMLAYPNPFSNSINLELPNNPGNLRIYDIQGALVYEEAGLSGKVSLDLSKLPAGMYNSVFNHKGELFTSRIFKTN